MEDKFRESFEKSPIGIAFLDKEGNLTDVNQSTLKIMGYPSLNEILKLNIFDDPYIAPKKDELLEEGYIKILSPVNFDNIKKSGIYTPTRFGTAFLDLTISIIDSGFLMQIQDITEHKKAEEELKESEARFRSVLDNSIDALYRVNLKTNQYEYLSPAFKDVVGFSPKEFKSMTSEKAISIIHPDDLSTAKDALASLEIKEHIKVDYRVRDSVGKYRWLSNHISLIRDDEGQPLYRDGTIRNITEQKKAEEELRKASEHLEEQIKERTAELGEAYNSLKESESKFKTLAESSPDIINRIDNEFKTVYINPAIIEISNKPPEHFIGKNIDKLGIPEEFTVPLKEKTIKTFNTREIQEFETKIPTVKGVKTFYTYLAPEFDEKREVTTVFTVSHDITELKEAEKRLKEIIQELERSNRELEQFAYVSSHDLQEPLRTIASFTQLLERRYKGKFDSDADEFMDYIVEAAVRMKAQIEGLLEYSRVGTKGEEFKPVDMNRIINETIQSLNISIKETNANIKVNELPEVMGDENQLLRVFQNLISNAIKFKKQEEPLKIHISANKDIYNKEYVFCVQDNGIGIEEQYKERIFTIFQRLHTRDVYKGTGIGLSIVKRIIERHGGRVWVESEFGVGSVFYFTLPVEQLKLGEILTNSN